MITGHRSSFALIWRALHSMRTMTVSRKFQNYPIQLLSLRSSFRTKFSIPLLSPWSFQIFHPPIVEASASPHPVDRAQTPAARPSLSHVHQLSCAEGSVQVQGLVKAAAQVRPRKDKTKKPGGQKRKAPKIEATAVPAGKKRKMVGKSVPMVQARGPSARLVLFLLCN